ncbi:MAG: alpha/beta fold hydrolase [Pseudonocardia sp.]|nr:alpha/beta fold hydrolase [Pseudonocardia sp.]
MSMRFVGCEASTLVRSDEKAVLDQVRDAEWTAADEEWCELEPGHAGPHVVSAARSPDGTVDEPWWWLWWIGDQRHLGTGPVCPARLGVRARVDNGHCDLPRGHAGRHSYEWSQTPATAHLDGYLLDFRVIEATEPGPPVVFVNALGTTMTTWQRVLGRLSPGPQLLTYDRAGLGNSSPRPPRSRTATYGDFAAELVELLDLLGITTPVVLVGHSIGSLIVRMLAARWPDRVAGMVHVDGTIPAIVALDKSDWLDGNSDKATLIDHAAGTDEINAITSYPAVPGVVMVKTPGRWPDPPIPDLDERWSEAEQLLAEQTGAVRVDAVDAGHHLQDEVPDLVTLAIRAVLDAATHGTPVLLDRSAVGAAGGTLEGPVCSPDLK